MKELRRKQRMKELLYSWPALILMVVLVFFLIKGSAEVMVKERESAKRVENLEKETEALSAREAELRDGIARLQTEEGIVEEIREKFSVAREGEYVAIIVDEKANASSTESTEGSWYKKILGAIMSLYE